MKARLLHVLVILLVSTGSVCAQGGIIRGKVRLPSGATLTGVIVELWRSTGLENQVVTTRDGDFEFANLPQASYEVVVKHQGYYPAMERAEFFYDRNSIPRVEVIRVEINLRPLESTTNEKAGSTFVQEIPPAARAAYDQGIAKLREGQPVEAVALLREATSIFAEYFDAHVALGARLLDEKKYEEALGELEKARLVNDRDAKVYQLFGVLMAAQQKYALAEWAFRAAIDRDPLSLQSIYNHGVVLIELSRTEPDAKKKQLQLNDAEKDLNRALEMTRERYYPAYLQRSRIHEMRDNRKAAARDLETYLKLNPNSPRATEIRAKIERLTHQP
jgi:tetratricopeptide (TPR) repeat protein